MTASARWAKIVLLVSAVVSTLFSAGLLISWHSGAWNFVKILPSLPLFPYLVYLNLFIISSCLLNIAIGRPRWSLIGGIISFGFGSYCFAQQVLNLNPGSLYLWFTSHIPHRIIQLTRVSPNTAVCLILSGLAVSLMSLKSGSWIQKFRPAILGITGAALFTIGGFAIISSIPWMTSLETWSRFAQNSLHVPPILTFIGAAILAYSWNDREGDKKELPPWLPIPVGIAVLVATLILWESLTAHEAVIMDQTIQLQAATVKNEVASRIDFSTQALIRMTKRWESWKNPTHDLVQSDVGIFLNLFTGCISIERLNTNLTSKWAVSFRNSKPNGAVQKQIKAMLSEPAILATILKSDFQKSIKMINLDSSERGFVLFYPVIKEKKLDGYIYAIFRSDIFLDNILSDNIAPGYLITVYDGEKEIFRRPTLDSTPDTFSAEWTKEIKINIGQAIWRIQVCPTPTVLLKTGSAIPEFALVGGIILAILFSIVVHLGRTAHTRTQALRTVNQDLQNEIQERKYVEAQLEEARDAALESARVKAEFVANMSHEIRTPMNGIIGMTGLLLETELSTKQKEFASMIRSSSEALLTIINDILDFSKIEAGKLTFERLDFNLNNVVDGVLDVFTGAIASKRIDLAASIASSVPRNLRGDPGRLRQVLTNIVGNAVKFTQHGEVLLEVNKEHETESHVRIRFLISDSGIGISPKQKGKLFQSFSQLDNSTTRKYGGTGLGLAISKQLIKQMEGEIDYKSVLSKGSQFWFTVTLEKQNDAPNELPFFDPLKNKRLLVIEDNAKCRNFLKEQLLDLSVQCDTCESVTKAIPHLQGDQAYDAVLIDLESDLSGTTQFIKEVQNKQAKKRPKLIGLSTDPNHTDREEVKKLEVSRIISKPLKLLQLAQYLGNGSKEEGFETGEVDNQQGSQSDEDGSGDKVINRKHLRILVVEDNIVNQKVALRQLEKLGYSAEAVSNGIEALKNLETIPYDIILMDCQMAEMDGYQTATEIRKIEGDQKHTPIIAMTAHVLEGDKEKCLASGMDDYLSKPVDTEALKSALERWSPRKTRTYKKKGAPQATVQDRFVDLQRLKEIGNNDPTEIKEMVKLYLMQTTEIMKNLKSSIETRDSHQIMQLAHKGSGSSSSCGMLTLAPLFLKLEQTVAQNSWEENELLQKQITTEFTRVRELLSRDFQLALNKQQLLS